MIRQLLILSLVGILNSCEAQKPPIYSSEIAPADTIIETDSSIITTKYFSYLNSIRVFNELKGTNRSYYADYFHDTKKLREEGEFVGGNSVGIWKEYDEKGELIREIDYYKGVVTYRNEYYNPFEEVQVAIKFKADSLIQAKYSPLFFSDHVRWNLGSSYQYNHSESGRWVELLSEKPTKFLLRYNLVFEGETYVDFVTLEFDSTGSFIEKEPFDGAYGFEKLNKSQPKTFTINTQQAFKTAQQMGLEESDTSKAQGFLFAEPNYNPGAYTAKYAYFIILKTQTLNNVSRNTRSEIIDKYDVYEFSPWTGDFVRKKRMKAIRAWEPDFSSGLQTGLMPDE